VELRNVSNLHVENAVIDRLANFGAKASMPISRRAAPVTSAIVAVLVIGFLFELYVFAHVQDLWMDESTQLTGAALKFTDMFRWLAGEHLLDPYGVPGDRMPPLSYLIDWAWLRLYGPSEIGLRLFHSLFVVIGAIGLSFFVWRNLGLLAGVVVFAFYVLSPKLIQIGVEIRAYPIFFAISCAQAALFVKLVADPDKLNVRWLAAFVLVCLAAIYTHFYGLVSSSAFFLVLGLVYIKSLVALARLVVAGTATLVGSLGILPFILAGVNRSAAMAPDETAGRHFIFLLKLVGDPANVVSFTATVLFFGGVLALLGAGLIAILERLRQRRLMPFDWLLAVVVVGISVTLTTSFVVTTCSPLTTSYSIWLFPPIGMLVAVGSTSLFGFRLWDNAGRFVAIAMIVLGSAYATSMFLSNADMFAHGPRRFVGALYDSEQGPKAIVYEVGAYWKFGYFPLVFSHKNQIDQYRAVSGDKLLRIERGDGLFGIESGPQGAVAQPIEIAVAPYKTILIVDVQLRSYRDVRQCQNGGSECLRLTAGAVETALTNGGKWQETKAKRMFGLYDTQVKKLEHVGDSPSVTGRP
jgi:hypothetical protein